MNVELPRRLGAEFLGTAFLLAIVVGSGVMGQRLAGGQLGLALMANAVATGCGLALLIWCLGPLSGAHFNPAVTLVFWLRRDIAALPALLYVLMQAIGAIVGVAVAHAMFDLPLVQIAVHRRTGAGQWIGETVATFGLVFFILMALRRRPQAIGAIVGLYITAAYWFTSSTSFANPAVTLARAFSATFAGIAPADVPAFVLAQLASAAFGYIVAGWLWPQAPGLPAKGLARPARIRLHADAGTGECQ
ncbi:MAG: aquaporin family protein [Alphaproteobacteria bacterium]|nr:MAG: aquaporin family protein [Alphaproteobacteria bacterium]